MTRGAGVGISIIIWKSNYGVSQIRVLDIESALMAQGGRAEVKDSAEHITSGVAKTVTVDKRWLRASSGEDGNTAPSSRSARAPGNISSGSHRCGAVLVYTLRSAFNRE